MLLQFKLKNNIKMNPHWVQCAIMPLNVTFHQIKNHCNAIFHSDAYFSIVAPILRQKPLSSRCKICKEMDFFAAPCNWLKFAMQPCLPLSFTTRCVRTIIFTQITYLWCVLIWVKKIFQHCNLLIVNTTSIAIDSNS